MIQTIEKFRGYVEGIRFIVHCDHTALSCLKSLKNLTACLLRPNALPRTAAEAVFTVDQVQDPWYRKLVNKMNSERAKFSNIHIVNDTLFKNYRCWGEVGIVYHKWSHPERRHISAVPKILRQTGCSASQMQQGIYENVQKCYLQSV